MKLSRHSWPFLLAAALGLGGCVAVPVHDDYGYGYYEEETIIVTPPPRVEYRGYAPAAGYIWIDGYWDRVDRRHHWVPGYWAPPGARHGRPHLHQKQFERERRPAWIRDRDDDHEHKRDRWRDEARERDARRTWLREHERNEPRERRRERTREDDRDRARDWERHRQSHTEPGRVQRAPARAAAQDDDWRRPRERGDGRDARHAPPPGLIRTQGQHPARAEPAPQREQREPPRRRAHTDEDGRAKHGERGRAERPGWRQRDDGH